MTQLPPKLRFSRRARNSKTVDGRLPLLAPSRPTSTPRRSLGGLVGRLAQPLPLIGIVLLIVATAGYLAVAAGSHSRSSEVVVAARSLPAGSRLTVGDLRLVKLSADRSLLGQLLPASVEQTLVGRRLTGSVLAGLPIGRASIAAAGAGGPAAFTLALPALHALGGNLTVGDRVSVLATFTSQSGAATARVLARNLVVLNVGQPPAGLDANSSSVAVTVALPNPSIASELALANSVGKIDLLRDGANSTAAIANATAAGNGTAP